MDSWVLRIDRGAPPATRKEVAKGLACLETCRAHWERDPKALLRIGTSVALFVELREVRHDPTAFTVRLAVEEIVAAPPDFDHAEVEIVCVWDGEIPACDEFGITGDVVLTFGAKGIAAARAFLNELPSAPGHELFAKLRIRASAWEAEANRPMFVYRGRPGDPDPNVGFGVRHFDLKTRAVVGLDGKRLRTGEDRLLVFHFPSAALRHCANVINRTPDLGCRIYNSKGDTLATYISPEKQAQAAQEPSAYVTALGLGTVLLGLGHLLWRWWLR